MDWFPAYEFILASKSPRRKELLKEMGLSFTVSVFDVPEDFPDHLSVFEIPVFLAEMKAKPFSGILKENELVVAADTIVSLDGKVLNKPSNREDAFQMLRMLSGNVHQVITAICLKSARKQKSFYEVTDVVFKELSDLEIDYYLDHYEPYDKAGAYGIQEWIGFIGITRIEGSYFNVVGLPVQKLYEEIRRF